MPKSTLTFLLFFITTTKIVYCLNVPIQFISEVFLENGDSCVSSRDGVVVDGVCMPVYQCPIILASVQRKKCDHTVCGYEGKTQIVCCPTIPNNFEIQLRQVEKIDIQRNLECVVANTNETGVIKFLNECPELSTLNPSPHINRLCTDLVCSDLVCCPVASRTRLKNVCSFVDNPVETLTLRLLLNRECIVKGLNIKGRYQQSCSYAERNPNLESLLQNVCNDRICQNYYCCPIEDGDMFECNAKGIESSTATLVGPKCIDSKSGRKGTCKQSLNCGHHNVSTLDNCGSYCCDDFYCCPDDLVTYNEPISARECRSYTKYLSKEEIEVPMNLYANRTDCPTFAKIFVAGGTLADPGEFPHMAALGYRVNNEILWKCGGSLISDRFVLTAGHCLTDIRVGSVQKVRLGVINLLTDIRTNDCPEDFDVAKLIPHPDYNRRFVYNDIGLIELGAQVKFNFNIRPICLPPNGDILQYYKSMGFGATGNEEVTSDKLFKVNQELFSYEECAFQYNVTRRFPNGIMNETSICAGSRDSDKSTCVGDSGGPLVADHFTQPKLFYIYGVVSFGAPCGFANSPGVYTKVFPYVKWIEDEVWKN